MKLIIILCAYLAITNATFFKLWKKKKGLGKVGSLVKKSTAATGVTSSIFNNFVISDENDVPRNAVPVVIVPLSSSPVLQYPLPYSQVQLSPYASSYQYIQQQHPIQSVKLQDNFQYHHQLPVVSQSVLKLPESYQYYQQLYPHGIEAIATLPETLPTSETIATSEASLTVAASEHNAGVIQDHQSLSAWQTPPVEKYKFIPSSISATVDQTEWQQSLNSENANTINTNSYTGDYDTSYTLQDGTLVTENARLVDGKDGNKILVKTGTYQRKGENDELVTVKWIADEDGFRVLES